MTECITTTTITTPSILMLSPTTTTNIYTTNNNNSVPPISLLHQRRSSIRRGTIASISKDVRVPNEDVPEIIKTQKALNQKERIIPLSSTSPPPIPAVSESSTLSRRHSMMNISKPNKNQQNKTSSLLRSRTRTVSNTDLKSNYQQKSLVSIDETELSAIEAKSSEPGKIRLDDSSNKSIKGKRETSLGLNNNSLRKCEACAGCAGDGDGDDGEGGDTSVQSDSTSSCSTQISSQEEWASTEKTRLIVADINANISTFSSHIQQLSKCLLLTTAEQDKQKSQLQECKDLVSQQQNLLAQLESNLILGTPLSSPPDSSLITNDDTSVTSVNKKKGLFHGLFSTTSNATPKTIAVVIKQKQDKKEVDTIVSVQGICTTIEAPLIPQEFIQLFNNRNQSQFQFQFQYSIDITFDERKQLFVLMDQAEWQKDQQVTKCTLDNCHHSFGIFQRKHHCRGCGNVYCSTHSNNRLPLFAQKNINNPVFSRVCDSCFFSLVKIHSLTPLL